MALAKDEPHYWAPISHITAWLTQAVIRPSDLVLDVGCGHSPFARADVAVDFMPHERIYGLWDYLKVTKRPRQFVRADFTETLPFADKSFDFVFCRHTIEDLYDPFSLVREMQRVGKAGYIETPSPIAELTRGIDGYCNGELWRGYHHHRFFCWVRDGRLNLLSKYPMVEVLQFNDEGLEEALRRGPELWNTYFLWTDRIDFEHWQNSADFDFSKQYGEMVWQAALDSAHATDAFCQMVNKSVCVAA